MARVLITGGAGFIGRHTTATLVAAGHQVRILDVLDPQIHGVGASFSEELRAQADCRYGDVCDLPTISAALEDIDVVFHLAAKTGVGQSMYDVRAYNHTNVTGTATLIEALSNRKTPLQRLVLASSRAVYGEGTHRCLDHGEFYPELRSAAQLAEGEFAVRCPHCQRPAEAVPTVETRPCNPTSIYGWTKKHQEDLCHHAQHVLGIPTVVLRYFNVYGAGQSLNNPYTGVMTVFYNRLKNGSTLSLYENGSPLRDFVHVRDVAQANLLAMQSPTAVGGTFNIGSGKAVTIGAVAETLAALRGPGARLEQTTQYRVGDIFACIAALEASRRELGYTPQVTLTEGLREFLAWAETQPAMDGYERSVAELVRHGLFGQAHAKTSAATLHPFRPARACA